MADNNIFDELKKLNERFTQQEARIKDLEREIQIPFYWRKAHREQSKKSATIASIFVASVWGLLGVFLIIMGLREELGLEVVLGLVFIAFSIAFKVIRDRQIRKYEELSSR